MWDPVRVMGKEYSGKKSPDVITLPFSLAHGPEHNKIPKAMIHPPTKIIFNLFIRPCFQKHLIPSIGKNFYLSTGL
jgi:hypothetical protein